MLPSCQMPTKDKAKIDTPSSVSEQSNKLCTIQTLSQLRSKPPPTCPKALPGDTKCVQKVSQKWGRMGVWPFGFRPCFNKSPNTDQTPTLPTPFWENTKGRGRIDASQDNQRGSPSPRRAPNRTARSQRQSSTGREGRSNVGEPMKDRGSWLRKRQKSRTTWAGG